MPRIPHFTTINKFALRVKPHWFDAPIGEIISSVETEEAVMCPIDWIYGELIYAKKFRTHKIGAIGKVLAYNTEKTINLNLSFPVEE